MRGGIARLLGLGLLAADVARGTEGASGWRDQVTLTLSQRIRGEFVDWFRPPAGKARSGANRYNFLGNQLRAGVQVTIPHLRIVAEAQDTGSSTSPTTPACRRRSATSAPGRSTSRTRPASGATTPTRARRS